MEKYFSKFKLKDYLTLAGLIVVGFGWLMVDQEILEDAGRRFIALIVLLIALFYLQFQINKPAGIIKYANTLALITVWITVLTILIFDWLIMDNFTVKALIIWFFAAVIPYLTAYFYKETKSIMRNPFKNANPKEKKEDN